MRGTRALSITSRASAMVVIALIVVSPDRESVDDEQGRTRDRRRSMRVGVIRDLVARTRNEPKRAAVAQFRLELAAQAEEDVSLLAPVVRTISCRILDHANADRAELARARSSDTRFSSMLRDFEAVPVRGAEGNVLEVHGGISRERLQERHDDRSTCACIARKIVARYRSDYASAPDATDA